MVIWKGMRCVISNDDCRDCLIAPVEACYCNC
ncbi:hypothetical protein C5167_007254, partial [Papaver somniferum]